MVAGEGALITGAGNGIGRATVIILANRGRFHMRDTGVAAGEETTTSIAEQGSEAFFVLNAAESEGISQFVTREVGIRQAVS